MERFILLVVLCFCVCSTTAVPVRTGVQQSTGKKSAADSPSPREKVQLLQRKLADLQKNLERLGGTIDAVEQPENDPLYEPDGTIEEELERAVGIRLTKFDDDDVDDVVEQLLSEKIDSDEAPSSVELTEIKIAKVEEDKIVEEVIVEDEQVGLTSGEKHLLEMLQEKEAGRRKGDVLRHFLEESLQQHQERAIPVVTDDDVIDDVHTSKEAIRSEENGPDGQTEGARAEEQRPLAGIPPELNEVRDTKDAEFVDNGYFVERPFTDSELGPVDEIPARNVANLSPSDNELPSSLANQPESVGKAQLDEVESKIIMDLKDAMDHGISLDDLLSDVNAKEQAALEKETYELGQQLAAAQRDLEMMRITSK